MTYAFQAMLRERDIRTRQGKERRVGTVILTLLLTHIDLRAIVDDLTRCRNSRDESGQILAKARGDHYLQEDESLYFLRESYARGTSGK